MKLFQVKVWLATGELAIKKCHRVTTEENGTLVLIWYPPGIDMAGEVVFKAAPGGWMAYEPMEIKEGAPKEE